MKVYTTEDREATKRGLVWEIETDSILIKEKRKHLSKTSDRVSKMLKRKHLKFGFLEKRFIEVLKRIRYRIHEPSLLHLRMKNILFILINVKIK
jgi:hypothetical protein